MAYVFKSDFASLLHSSYSRSYSWSRSCSRRSTKLDWNRGIFDSAVRIYEVCDDYFLGKVFSRTAKLITSFKRGLLPALSFVFLAFGMIMLQPDLGTGTVMVGTCIIMIFISGREFSLCNVWFDWCSRICRVNCISTVSNETHYIIFRSVVRSAREWISNYQSLLAIGPGGLFGLGLGQSRQKFLYLPEPQTDFIFAILSEELGFIGGSFVLLLFSLLLWRGIRIALGAPDLYGTF